MSKKYYMVETRELGYPQYLDGFRDGFPVWKSSLQSVDPFISYGKAIECARDSNGAVVAVEIDDCGYTRISKTL